MSDNSTWFQRGMQTIVRMGRPNNPAATQRSSNPHREIFSDLISYVLFFDMSCGHKPLLYQEFRDGVLALVNAQEGRAKALGVAEESFRQARFAVLSWVDEMVLNSTWPHRSQWQYLMLIYFRTSNAGEEFFRRLEQLPAKDNQIREIYYLCLSLGFQGKYLFENDKHELNDIQRALYKQLASANGDIRQSYQRLFTDAYVKVAAAPQAKRQQSAFLRYLVTLSIPLILAAILWGVLRKQSNDILAQIQEPTSPPIQELPRRLCSLPLVDELRQKGLRAVDEPEAVRITLDSLLFPVSSTELSPAAETKIKQIATILQACNVKNRIKVEGHASCEGDCLAPIVQERNRRLSQERAETVRQAFGRLNIRDDRISAQGFGTSKPIDQDQTKNRRVEIVVAK